MPLVFVFKRNYLPTRKTKKDDTEIVDTVSNQAMAWTMLLESDKQKKIQITVMNTGIKAPRNRGSVLGPLVG